MTTCTYVPQNNKYRRNPVSGSWIGQAIRENIPVTSTTTDSYRNFGEDSLTYLDQENWGKYNTIVKTIPQEFTTIDTLNIIQPELEKYTFRDFKKVDSFLHLYPELAFSLRETYPILRRIFGPEPEFFLEVVTDPEIEEVEEQTLFVYIRSAMEVEEATEKLDQFYDEWYLEKSTAFGDILAFNLELI